MQQSSRRADRFDLGEVFLEIALVVTSITLLTEKRAYWYLGFVFAAIGLVAAASGCFSIKNAKAVSSRVALRTY